MGVAVSALEEVAITTEKYHHDFSITNRTKDLNILLSLTKVYYAWLLLFKG